MKLKILSLIITCFFVGILQLNSQVPSPAPPQDKPIVLIGATAHLGNGEVINNSVIAFDKGKITLVSNETDFGLDLNLFEVVNVEGKHVYPGLILPNVGLGLVEVGSVRATVDSYETGILNPNVRSIVAYNTDSEAIPVLRSNGILIAQITPGGGMVSGSSTIVQLDAWNWEDAVYKLDDGIHMSWPSMYRRSGFSGSGAVSLNTNYEATVKQLEKLFTDAAAYNKLDKPEVTNLKLNAMKGLFTGDQTLYVRAGNAKEIIESVQFARKHGVEKVVLVSIDEDVLKITEFIKENNIPIIVAGLTRMPKRKDEDIKIQFKLPYLLHKEGILVGLDLPSPTGAMNYPFFAGIAIAYGMDKEDALKTITSNMAKILGIDDRVGSLEEGKDATIIVSTGDLLDIRTSNVELAYINGRNIDLDNKHKRLYKKYKKKYEDIGK